MRQKVLFSVLIIAAFAVAVAGGYFYSKMPKQKAPEATPSDVPTPPPGVPTPAPGPEVTEPNFVDVRDQESGRQVTVHAVSMIGPGYIYIHLTDEEGKAGQVIGQSALIETTKVDVVINLSQSTQSGQTLIAMLHNEDREPLVGNAGQVIQREFTITSTSEN
ncbi:hypothetical protein A2630_02880 [Candidatus Woesebacteria bacterium RIFCSPHIGHO2_01_FULL_44_10]|uniref:DUF7282 domain-containing protein n=1 Tax=Candidatus Woesebacteria bacterium RIFCSPLOWO2_01_FULL_44_14 TaxID=1802525 RepID=A0A1F8C2H1_9BACT|nr:MAG: hypothetical protein A2630_02880 [Candidatus Woesebacteria bacterium RIFCSPHIGHO2_01_FULL_44_10]OGM55728.1 MAG: hypothetical protein A3F62_04575 [Candidatus Woesebacteria bacterium RIFCSPHIGHO2_12_FULL_44_11]OGM70513.1 MAG: hypothetical protein A2975_01910 [Candidatus Woesebacteria bacterium RIFCSPLOWO2_01_FULL_44_14]